MAAADESVASRAVAAALEAFNEPSMLQALQAVRWAMSYPLEATAAA